MRNPKFLGVYSLKTASAGGPKPKFFVWLLPNGNYAIQELDASFSQRGPARALSPENLAKAFRAEPSLLAAPVTTPDFRPLLGAGNQEKSEEDNQERSQRESADRTHWPRQLETNLRTAFTRALQALKRPKDRQAATVALERILRARDGIDFSHRHMFRDFGVALRKQAQPELARLSAQRAVALSPQDDHARFNLARILGILGRYDEAEAQLEVARRIDPNETVYDLLSRYLERERQGTHRSSNDDD